MDAEESEVLMREVEVTDSSKAVITEAFKNSFWIRRNWIVKQKPLASEIFERFPRFRDFPEGASLHFLRLRKRVLRIIILFLFHHRLQLISMK